MSDKNDDLVGRLRRRCKKPDGARRRPSPRELEAATTIETLQAKLAEAERALDISDTAITEMFRYYDGGETRGSYDGKPERRQLRNAGYTIQTTLASIRGK